MSAQIKRLLPSHVPITRGPIINNSWTAKSQGNGCRPGNHKSIDSQRKNEQVTRDITWFFFCFVSVCACECVFAKLSSSQVLIHHLSGLMQERLNSNVNALELRLSCINPSIYQQLSCALLVAEWEIFHSHIFFPWTKYSITIQVEVRTWHLTGT